MTFELTPEILLRAYAVGIFPMAETRDDDDVFWLDPKKRGIFPLSDFHISRSLTREIRLGACQIRTNTDFPGVVQACAGRPDTWISNRIQSLYEDLHAKGRAHSVEVWDGPALVGGVYGVALGAAFFGESMFSRRRNASKIALAYLTDRLRIGGFTLFDAQFLTPHLQSLGAIEISRAEYQRRLHIALARTADFHRQSATPSAAEVLQRNSQTS